MLSVRPCTEWKPPPILVAILRRSLNPELKVLGPSSLFSDDCETLPSNGYVLCSVTPEWNPDLQSMGGSHQCVGLTRPVLPRRLNPLP